MVGSGPAGLAAGMYLARAGFSIRFADPGPPGGQARRIEQLVLAGVATNLCVESTARHAFDLGFQTFVVVDATAARTEELHLGSLKGLAFGFSVPLLAEGALQCAQPAAQAPVGLVKQ